MTISTSYDPTRTDDTLGGWRRTALRYRNALRRWIAAPALDRRAPLGATAWLLYHPPGVMRIVTPAESAALDRVRRSAAEA